MSDVVGERESKKTNCGISPFTLLLLLCKITVILRCTKKEKISHSISFHENKKKVNNDQHMGLALLSWLMMLAKSKLKRSATARKSQGQSEPILNEHAKYQNKLFHHFSHFTYFGKRSTKKFRFRSLVCWYV